MEIRLINLNKSEHRAAFRLLLNEYMKDKMGLQKPLEDELAQKVMEDLGNHPVYRGFLVQKDNDYLALANCFINYSTFSGHHLINIHDFVVHPQHRGQGVGFFLLSGIQQYALQQGYCRINLEVRHDNHYAMQLYRKFGFKECNPPMYFWEKQLPVND